MGFFKKKEKNNSDIKRIRVKMPVHKPSANITTIISSDVTIKGDIILEGHLDLSGTIRGHVTCGSITIRKNAVIVGDVTANDTVKVSGKVKGTVKGKSVFLHDDCHMEGTVYQESLVIEDGAFLDGQCKRLAEESDTASETLPDEPTNRIQLPENTA